MNLHRLLQQRASDGKPLRVALIGAGKFGSMFLAQARRTPGIHVVAVADLDPAASDARASLARDGRRNDTAPGHSMRRESAGRPA